MTSARSSTRLTLALSRSTLAFSQSMLAFAVFSFLSLAGPRAGSAQSALDLIGGFDRERIEQAYPAVQDNERGELSRLLYRVQNIDREALRRRSRGGNDETAQDIGAVVEFEGTVKRIGAIEVPESLVEFLEFSRIIMVDVEIDVESETTQTHPMLRVLTTAFPTDATAGDSVRGIGVVIEPASAGEDAKAAVLAAPRVEWFPADVSITGWQLLAQQGVDIAQLTAAHLRSGTPLSADDNDLFYSMMAAAAEIAQQESLPEPARVKPITLLDRSQNLAGRWVRLLMETVQVTRVAVTEPRRQRQLGSDHYFQIDAMADLGDVVVKIERADGQAGEEAVFENRYPISIVTRELPPFLQQRIQQQQGRGAVLAEFKAMILVDAFYLRLWSYRSDYMDSRGGGQQLAPLLVASRIYDRRLTSDDPIGVRWISYVAAVAVLAAVLAIWWWLRVSSARDRAARQRRKEREARHVELP